MNRTETLRDYGARVQRTIAHMAANLDRDLDLDTLAGVACFSPCHFHRIYRAIAGETLAQTMRRLRLNRAAADLIQGRSALAAVARRAGYGSVEAFTRAFRSMYAVTPGAYRRSGRLIEPASKPTDETEAMMYDVTIETVPTLRLAGVDHYGPFATMGATFAKLAAWAAGNKIEEYGTRYIGIYPDDPERVPADRLHAIAAMTVGPQIVGEGDVRIFDLPGGPCARVLFKGPYAELEAVYRWLYRDWLPTSGHDPADRPCFEEYLNDYRDLPPAEWLTAVYMPLAT